MKTEKRKTMMKTWKETFITGAITMARDRHMSKANAMWTAGLWLWTASNKQLLGRDPFTGEKK